MAITLYGIFTLSLAQSHGKQRNGFCPRDCLSKKHRDTFRSEKTSIPAECQGNTRSTISWCLSFLSPILSFSLFFLQIICTKHFHKKKERTQEERKEPVLYPKSYQKNSGTQRQIGKNSFYTQETWKGQEGFQVAAISSLVLILELTWIFSHVWFSLSTGMAEGKAVGGIKLGFTLSTLL